MRSHFFLGFHYLFSRKSYRGLALLKVTALTGIIVSVFSFLIIHSVMKGFSSHLQSTLRGFQSDLTIQGFHEDQLHKLDSFTKNRENVVEFDGILQTWDELNYAVHVKGIDWDHLERDGLKIYYFPDIADSQSKNPRVLIGEELYGRFAQAFGDKNKVTLINPVGALSPTGELSPTTGVVEIVGIFKAGFYDYDNAYVLMDATSAAGFIEEELNPHRLALWVKAGLDLKTIKEKVLSFCPKCTVRTWEEQNQRYLTALNLEKIGMTLLLMMVSVITSLNVFSLVLLSVVSKNRDVAILYCLGADKGWIAKVFVMMGFLLGLLGTLVGLSLALVSIYFLKTYPIFLPSAYYLEFLPIELDLKILFFLLFLVPLVTMVVSLWPSYRVKKMSPIEILRNSV